MLSQLYSALGLSRPANSSPSRGRKQRSSLNTASRTNLKPVPLLSAFRRFMWQERTHSARSRSSVASGASSDGSYASSSSSESEEEEDSSNNTNYDDGLLEIDFEPEHEPQPVFGFDHQPKPRVPAFCFGLGGYKKKPVVFKWPKSNPQPPRSATFTYHAFTQIRLEAQYRRQVPKNIHEHAIVRRRIQYQRLHDARILGIKAEDVHFKIPLTVQPFNRAAGSQIARAWWRFQAAIAQILEEREPVREMVYEDTQLGRYMAYTHEWDLAVQRRVSFPGVHLRFSDVPWPIKRVPNTPVTHNDITSLNIHRFLLRESLDEPLQWVAVRRIEREILRWTPLNVRKLLLPLIIPYEREKTNQNAIRVYNILLKMRRELVEYFDGLKLERAHIKLRKLNHEVVKKAKKRL
ncbi:hypothetical protein HMN09_00947700 [Mycena chlorophos]|uniref:Uncharacterized protein n=1 Tax=Mycena chlorophos TaxID=658473 RepID=A0A8H6SMN3_MYCCL|nr:hypothetical protein HMN09_00947700 [Mycena chlorophos]